MTSYLIVELDTTSPQIEIYAPRYTTKEIVNAITIQSDEKLASFQEVYVIDSAGVRHDYTFQQENDTEFIGLIRFNDFPFGLATIYARMKDEVDNYSDLVYESFEIKETSTFLSMKINDKQRLIDEKINNTTVKIKSNIRNANTTIKLNNSVIAMDKGRKINIQNRIGE